MTARDLSEMMKGPFWEAVSKDCWPWTGRVDRDGYGLIKIQGTQYRVHRLAYEDAKGPIPEGLVIDHTCTIRRCVNPEHLEAVTHAENRRRTAQRQTNCVNGHERTPENTYIRPDNGARQCIPCQREQSRKHAEKKRNAS